MVYLTLLQSILNAYVGQEFQYPWIRVVMPSKALTNVKHIFLYIYKKEEKKNMLYKQCIKSANICKGTKCWRKLVVLQESFVFMGGYSSTQNISMGRTHKLNADNICMARVATI